MSRINVIGAGRVGQTMLRLLARDARHDVGDVLSSGPASAGQAVELVGAGRAVGTLSDMQSADIWFLAVPDTQIAMVSGTLAKVHSSSTAVHFSGFHVAGIMEPLSSAGWKVASAHPNRSFADPKAAAESFAGTPCGMEGDEIAVERISAILSDLGGKPFRIASERKSLYHAAAVFSNNFSTVLQAVAREMWDEAGVPGDVARDLNETLLRATVENVCSMGPRDALTGPAARGDRAVVDAQGEDVAGWDNSAGRVYSELSGMAARLKANGRTRP